MQTTPTNPYQNKQQSDLSFGDSLNGTMIALGDSVVRGTVKVAVGATILIPTAVILYIFPGLLFGALILTALAALGQKQK